VPKKVEALKAKGASEADFKEPALANLVFNRILEKHADEIRADQNFAEALFLMLHDEASPQELRKLAAQEREKGISIWPAISKYSLIGASVPE
jgi:hypothetical protein